MAGPLHGLRVLDASSFISGPFAGTMLADLGATVRKVEPEGGDGMNRWGRSVGGRGLVYANCNRGKSVVRLDLKDEAGVVAFLELAADADVLLTNWRAGVAERLGLAGSLTALPALVWLRISGWGATGPRADQPAFDGSIQAASGMAWVQGDDEPQLLRSFVADKVTACFAVQAVLAALHRRQATGIGAVVDLPMLDTLAYFNFPDMLQNRTVLGSALPARNEQTAANRPVRTADGWLILSPVGGRQLKAALTAIGRPDAVEAMKRVATQHELVHRLVELCTDVLPTRTTAAWERIFEAADVPVATILDVDQHLIDAQVRHNGVYDLVEDPVLGTVRRARHPARFGDDDARGATGAVRDESPGTGWPDR